MLGTVLTLCTAACGGASDATGDGTTEDAVIGGQTTRKSSANDGSDTRRTVDTTLRALDGNLVRIGKTG